MKIASVIATLACVAVGFALVPAGASAGSLKDLARAECREERRYDRAEFVRDYGTGKGAIGRCVNRELRKARAECRSERRFEPAEFRAEYGTGKRAMNRCIRDEIR